MKEGELHHRIVIIDFLDYFIKTSKMITRTLSVVDYILLSILLLSSAVIGILFGFVKSKKSSAKEFLLGSGWRYGGTHILKFDVIPTALSICVSFLSAITLLGTPSEVYLYGTMYVYQASLATATIFMPKFREMNFTSAYEVILRYILKHHKRSANLKFFQYLEKRFDNSVRQAASLAFSVFMLIYMAIVLYAPALALSQRGRIQFDSVSFDPRTRHTIWSLLIGGTFNSLSTYGFNQTQVQRYMCVNSTRGAKQALAINAVGAALVIAMSCLIGVILYAYYATCDPYTAKYVRDIDQIFPYFVMEVLSDKKGLPGVFLACIFSGSLSTVSSGLNSLSAVIIEDVWKGLFKRKLTDERQGFVSKIFSVFLGAVVMLLTLVVSYLGSILNAALSLFGVLSGPVMGVFFLGFFFPMANRHGGIIGFVVCLAIQLWIFFGAQIYKGQMTSERLPLSIANCPIQIGNYTNITNYYSSLSFTLQTESFSTTAKSIVLRKNALLPFYSISYMWYAPIAVIVTCTVGVIVSYITGPLKPNEIDPKLIIPIFDKICCCLPKNIRKKLHFGTDYYTYQNKDLELKVDDATYHTFHTSASAATLTDTNLNYSKTNIITPLKQKSDQTLNKIISSQDNTVPVPLTFTAVNNIDDTSNDQVTRM
ncbi:unnamed protein product [Didymodactylos carnosus]|uniref:Sodium-coupled monocarboxylate transporter 1 n=1 Tax=Didymodactylos carnosus TaxID=1234261 RepID=A0A813NVU4_9BILA|nr:unnamed protein product [Didymodactylos carnosus]CAF0787820.1 unnamed protein product [Didymodactylos carnosus]CAF3522084.1 unnamed protein product [Didymodactylos carnosus]CAF3570185.1 unnamed protein product [Didymodactylos carnosus]